jgi:hypothetical protein
MEFCRCAYSFTETAPLAIEIIEGKKKAGAVHPPVSMRFFEVAYFIGS